MPPCRAVLQVVAQRFVPPLPVLRPAESSAHEPSNSSAPMAGAGPHAVHSGQGAGAGAGGAPGAPGASGQSARGGRAAGGAKRGAGGGRGEEDPEYFLDPTPLSGLLLFGSRALQVTLSRSAHRRPPIRSPPCYLCGACLLPSLLLPLQKGAATWSP